MIEQIINDPLKLSIAVGAIGIFVGIQIFQRADDSEPETIDAEGLKSKIKSIFTTPADSQGSTIKDIVKIRGTASTPRTLGMALKAKTNNIQIVKEKDDNSFETVDSEGTTYRIIEGSDKLMLELKAFISSKLGIKRWLTTYDVPKKLIVPGDKYIWFKPQSHFVKFNGIKRHFDLEGLSRAWEASFSKTHENYLETLGDIPEQYSVLNNRISGQLKIENMKSENFREFEKLKNEMDKMDAMNS